MPTLLASKILNNSYLSIKKRSFNDPAGMLPLLSGAQYFDCTKITDLATGFAETQNGVSELPQYVVLPEIKTWLEWRAPNGSRAGCLIDGENNLKKGRITFANKKCSGPFTDFNYEDTGHATLTIDWDSFAGNLFTRHSAEDLENYRNDLRYYVFLFVPCLLSIINTPKICKHVIRSKRFGLPRRSTPGKWPSDDTWTDVRIYVDQTTHRDPTVVGPLTGRKALHFVRTHFRYRLGRLEMVRPHWRGDASLGIVRSRYKPTRRATQTSQS